MTITKQLAVLESYAKVIDPDYDYGKYYATRHIVRWCYCSQAIGLPDADALAIREKQAMDWLVAWCDEHDPMVLSIQYGSPGVIDEAEADDNILPWQIMVTDASDVMTEGFGPTLAHALAKMLDAILNQETT